MMRLSSAPPARPGLKKPALKKLAVKKPGVKKPAAFKPPFALKEPQGKDAEAGRKAMAARRAAERKAKGPSKSLLVRDRGHAATKKNGAAKSELSPLTRKHGSDVKKPGKAVAGAKKKPAMRKPKRPGLKSFIPRGGRP